MSDGRRFFVGMSRTPLGYRPIVVMRERGDIPGILPARDVFVQELDERGDVRFVIKNPSKPYLREI